MSGEQGVDIHVCSLLYLEEGIGDCLFDDFVRKFVWAATCSKLRWELEISL